MTYATLQGLIDRFGEVELAQLTDRDNAVVVDTVVVGRALADADAEIDAYVGLRYELPLASVPPVLERLACDMARYALFGDRAPEAVRLRYEDAVKLLKSISKGDVKLPAATPLQAAQTGQANSVRIKTPRRVFDSDSLQGY